MRSQKQRVSLFRSAYQMYFKNGDANPAGDLLAAGIGYPNERNNWTDTRSPWAYPYYNFNIILGNGSASYHNEYGFQCELTFGNFLLAFPNVKHQYAPSVGGRWGEIYVCFAGDLFDIVRSHKIISPQQPVWCLSDPQPQIDRLQAFLQTPAASSPHGKLRRASWFLYYLLDILEEATPVRPSQPDSDWFDHACNLLSSDLHHSVDLRDIADKVGLSYHTFRSYFRRRAGMAPMHYRDTMRLKAACNYLLTTPGKSCNEIAFIVGYSTLQRFSEQFKKHLGMAPLEYRKKHLKN